MKTPRLSWIIFAASFLIWAIPDHHKITTKIITIVKPVVVPFHAPLHNTMVVDNYELNCMAKTIYFEAGNQPIAGKIMVGLVVVQRVKNPAYPHTICGVVHQHRTWAGKNVDCQFSWYCFPHTIDLNNIIQRKTWDESLRVAKLILSKDFYDTVDSDRMTMYHANYVHPYWANSRQYKKFIVIGDQSFYLDKDS